MTWIPFLCIFLTASCINPSFCNAFAFHLPRPLTAVPGGLIEPLPNLTVKSNVHCTSDNTWKSPSAPDLRRYLQNCKEAARRARKDLWFDGHYELEEEYEFLEPGTKAQTAKRQIRLPKIYTATSRFSLFPSCTIAIAMIDSLGPGPPLPGEPDEEFGPSDTMTLRQLLSSTFEPYVECIRRGMGSPNQWDPALGWSQAGHHGNVGVFYVGTDSMMGRRMPRADDGEPATDI